MYYTISNFTNMIIDQDTGIYVKKEQVKLMQTIFHSFQIENILLSLLREITQEYPDTEDEDKTKEEIKKKGNLRNKIKERKINFKESLRNIT